MLLKLTPYTAGSFMEQAINNTSNCNIDRNKCIPFTIPFADQTTFDDLFFQIRTPYEPVSITYFFIKDCDTSVGYQFLPKDYVVSQLDNGTWYITFVGIDVSAMLASQIPLADATCLNFFVIVDFASGSYEYNSEQYAKQPCENVTLIKACYNNDFSETIDSQDVYYGLPTDLPHTTGNADLRYYHNYTARNLTIKDAARKLTIKKVNYKPTRTTIDKVKQLNIADQLPSWYLDYIISAMASGYVSINSKTYILDEPEILPISTCCETFHLKSSIKETFNNALSCSPCAVYTGCDTPTFDLMYRQGDASTFIYVTITSPLSGTYDISGDNGVTWEIVGSATAENIITNFDVNDSVILVKHHCPVGTTATASKQFGLSCPDWCVKTVITSNGLGGSNIAIFWSDCYGNPIAANPDGIQMQFEIDGILQTSPAFGYNEPASLPATIANYTPDAIFTTTSTNPNPIVNIIDVWLLGVMPTTYLTLCP